MDQWQLDRTVHLIVTAIHIIHERKLRDYRTNITNYNIRVAHKPITILRRLLANVKDKDDSKDREGAVYKIARWDYKATCIGKTSRNLNVRLTERERATRNGDFSSNFAE